MSRFGKIAETIICGVIMAVAGTTIVAVLTKAILNDGQGIAIAVLVIGFGAPAIWDRLRRRRWPQPTELPPPHMQTAEVEIVERESKPDVAPSVKQRRDAAWA